MSAWPIIVGAAVGIVATSVLPFPKFGPTRLENTVGKPYEDAVRYMRCVRYMPYMPYMRYVRPSIAVVREGEGHTSRAAEYDIFLFVDDACVVSSTRACEETHHTQIEHGGHVKVYC